MEIIKLMQIKNKLRIRIETETHYNHHNKKNITDPTVVLPGAVSEQLLFVVALQQDPCLKYPMIQVFVEYPLRPIRFFKF